MIIPITGVYSYTSNRKEFNVRFLSLHTTKNSFHSFVKRYINLQYMISSIKIFKTFSWTIFSNSRWAKNKRFFGQLQYSTNVFYQYDILSKTFLLPQSFLISVLLFLCVDLYTSNKHTLFVDKSTC